MNNLIHALVPCKVCAEAEETYDHRAYTTTKFFSLYETQTEAEERASGIQCNIASAISSTLIDEINILFPLKIKKVLMKEVVE